MTATSHAVTGILIATVVKQPALALPLAFFSHFVIDMIPHWVHKFNRHFYTQLSVFFDFGLATLLTVVLVAGSNRPAWILISAAFLGVIPDAMWMAELWRPVDFSRKGKTLWSRVQWFCHKIQWSETQLGIIVEIAWCLATIALIASKN